MNARNAVRVRRRGARATAIRILVSLAAFAALLGAGYAGVRASQDPRLALGQIDVSGCSRSTAADVIAAAELPAGANIWLLDTGSAVARIDDLPWTKSAAIRRTWPNGVRVTVVERQPAARVDVPASGGGEEPWPQRALVDADMHVLAVGPDDPRDLKLPELRVSGLEASSIHPGSNLAATDAAAAYAAFRMLEAAGMWVRYLDIGAATGIGVETSDNLRVLFGTPDGLAQKVTLYRGIAAKIRRPRDVVFVDLRSARAPTVLFK